VTTTKQVSRGHFGLCSLWGDPHFKTFDGAKPLQQTEKVTFWIVQSSVFKMMGYSDWGGGTLTRVALVGGLLGNKKLVVRNYGDASSGWNDLQVFLDGARIAAGEGSRVEVGNGVVVQHGSSVQPNYNHVSSQAGMWDKVNAAGNNEFVIITFPDGDEVSLAGVVAKVKTKKGKTTLKDPPRMGVTIKLKSEAELTGACGNFNGNQADDNTVATNLGSLTVNPRAIPSGVLEEDLHSSLVRSLLDSHLDITRGTDKTYTQIRTECSANLLAAADSRCEGLPQSAMIEACVEDICITGDEDMWKDSFVVASLTVSQADGVVTEMDAKGKCQAKNDLTYASLTHRSTNDPKECEALLELVANIDEVKNGVQGAQSGPDSKCQILFDPDKNTSKALQVLPLGIWENFTTGTGGSQMVFSTDLNSSWTCWRVD